MDWKLADEAGIPEDCGNGRVDPGEECDQTDLAGQSCQSLGYAGGPLACTPQCTRDVSGCVDSGCGNGFCEPHNDENHVNCADDCGWKELSVGAYFVCGVKQDGSVWCWGSNQHEQLGIADTRSNVPVAIPGVAGVVTLSAGEGHACALRDDATLWCWGKNDTNQASEDTSDSIATPTRVLALSGVQSAAAGNGHTCAATTDGALWCWGGNAHGQLGDGSVLPRPVPQLVTGATTVQSVDAQSHTCVVLADGSAKCWGLNDEGQIGNGNTITPVTSPNAVTGLGGASQIAAGGAHTCAPTTYGPYCWGLNDNGQLGLGTQTSSPTAAPLDVTGGVRSFGLGRDHTCAVSQDGALWCWGHNVQGQLGTGSTAVAELSPVLVTDLPNVRWVSAWGPNTCAIAADRTAWCWGSNAWGQLGAGDTPEVQSCGMFETCAFTPQPVVDPY